MPEAAEEDQIDEERWMQLEESRHKASLRQKAKGRRQSKESSKINIIEGGLMLGFAIFMDLLDYFLVGLIPILGDILDIIAGAIIWLWVKVRGLDRVKPLLVSLSPGIATLVELFPVVGDIPPSFTIDVLFIIVLNTSWGKRLVKLAGIFLPV